MVLISNNKSNDERLAILETEVKNLGKKVDNQGEKIDKITDKIDDLRNGGITSAIQEQNEKLFNRLLDKEDFKDEFLAMKHQDKGSSKTKESIRKWGGWVVSIISVGVAIFALLGG